MKIGIPEFNDRVSPVFDCCQRLLVIDTIAAGPIRMDSQDWSRLACSKRLGCLLELGIETLLCGGISKDLAKEIEVGGIEVIPWLSGEVGDVLDAFLKDRLPDPGFTMPGCSRGQYKGKGRYRDGLSRRSGRIK